MSVCSWANDIMNCCISFSLFDWGFFPFSLGKSSDETKNCMHPPRRPVAKLFIFILVSGLLTFITSAFDLSFLVLARANHKYCVAKYIVSLNPFYLGMKFWKMFCLEVSTKRHLEKKNNKDIQFICKLYARERLLQHVQNLRGCMVYSTILDLMLSR